LEVASLVEELVTILKKEELTYSRLLEYGESKRQILIDADVPALEKLTDLEQTSSDELLSLSNKQVQILKDIATVLGRTDEKVTVTKLIGYLSGQPDIQTRLTDARDRLLDAAGRLQVINQQNEALLKQAIELAEFDITLFRSLRQAPETANYDKNANNTGVLLGTSGFDAKQ
jgi:flagellar biosynthesis/type III secretory pathway chaperone